jgi:hypothetical protein
LKKQREYEDEMNEATKAKEVTAYEDSWYRSLKALADMRPTEKDVRSVEVDEPPAEEKKASAEVDVYPADEVDEAPTDEDEHHVAEGSHHAVHDVRPVESDEETAGVPED